MHASIVLMALVGAADAKAETPKAPAWQTDYSAAQMRMAEVKKPLAVVVGNGPNGWHTLSRDGKINDAVSESLKNYVCVYVDTATEHGQQLADAFEMKGGLVISDITGAKQAFRHTGTLTNADLDGVLKRYADPQRVLVRTESYDQPQVRFYPTDAPAAAPATPTYAPAYLAPNSYCPSCRGR